MHYYDQHMHTYFSPDSVEKFENYLKQSDKTLITTEHLDFFSPYQNQADVIPDFPGYTAKIEQLNKEYDNRVRKGIEVGFTYPDKDRIQDYLSGKDFDLILLSVHHNGQYNFMNIGNEDVPLTEHLNDYYSRMLQAVQEFPNANVLAHFDYGLRGYTVTVDELRQVEKKLLKVFKTAVQNELAFELNTKSMYRHGNAHLYEYAIDLYLSAGGKMFTLGSDAHKAEDYEFHFKEAAEMLKRHGVEQLVTFQQQEPSFVPIPQEKVTTK